MLKDILVRFDDQLCFMLTQLYVSVQQPIVNLVLNNYCYLNIYALEKIAIVVVKYIHLYDVLFWLFPSSGGGGP